jgi:hypothetical protein
METGDVDMAAFFNRFSRQPQPRDGELHIEATDVRQARWGRHALVMLICSTALAVVALFGAWAFKSGDLADASARSTPTAAEAKAAGAPVG